MKTVILTEYQNYAKITLIFDTVHIQLRIILRMNFHSEKLRQDFTQPLELLFRLHE